MSNSGERSYLAPPPYKLFVCLSVCVPKLDRGASVWTVMLLSVCVCGRFVEGAPVNLTEVCLVLTRSLLTHLLTRLRTTYWPFTYLLLAEHKAGEEARERQPGLAGFSRARH